MLICSRNVNLPGQKHDTDPGLQYDPSHQPPKDPSGSLYYCTRGTSRSDTRGVTTESNLEASTTDQAAVFDPVVIDTVMH